MLGLAKGPVSEPSISLKLFLTLLDCKFSLTLSNYLAILRWLSISSYFLRSNDYLSDGRNCLKFSEDPDLWLSLCLLERRLDSKSERYLDPILSTTGGKSPIGATLSLAFSKDALDFSNNPGTRRFRPGRLILPIESSYEEGWFSCRL